MEFIYYVRKLWIERYISLHIFTKPQLKIKVQGYISSDRNKKVSLKYLTAFEADYEGPLNMQQEDFIK